MKPNKTNKIMILLSLFLILLNESNNNVYAIDYFSKARRILTITLKKNKNDESNNHRIIKIKYRCNKKESIQLSEEIIKSIFGDGKAEVTDKTKVTLNYAYLLEGETLEINTETILDEGLLITDSNVFISVKENNRLTINNSNDKRDIFE